MGQLLHWTSLRYVVPTGVPHMSVSLFSRPYSSVSAPRCALGISLCRPSKTTYCSFEPFKYNHVVFAYFSFLSNPLLHRSCRPPVKSIPPQASFEHSTEYHSHVGLDHACISNVYLKFVRHAYKQTVRLKFHVASTTCRFTS